MCARQCAAQEPDRPPMGRRRASSRLKDRIAAAAALLRSAGEAMRRPVRHDLHPDQAHRQHAGARARFRII
eukprot:133901-Chlamydomonas_euryale.AAC.2